MRKPVQSLNNAQRSVPLSSSAASLGDELVIEGKITSRGDLHLRGQIYGDVHCHKLLVGEQGEIQGNIVAEEVLIQGKVVGSVRASEVVLQAKCCVEGEVVCQSLTMEQGARFEGESRSTKDLRSDESEKKADESDKMNTPGLQEDEEAKSQVNPPDERTPVTRIKYA